MKLSGERISMITAYDFSFFARLFDQAGIDVILVGDSASNMMAGQRYYAPDYIRPDDLPCIICDP
jgi:3-methyl-2-oxobutanoate hydroxymethyltransferase